MEPTEERDGAAKPANRAAPAACGAALASPAGKSWAKPAAAVCACAMAAALAASFYALGQGAAAPSDPQPAQQPAAKAAHVHDWTTTYKTVRHDAVTRNVPHDAVYETRTGYHTVCNDCMEVVDGQAAEHVAATGHSGYTTGVPIEEEVLISQAWIETVVDEEAYDETVPDKNVCATCGATRAANVGSEG